MAVLHEVEGLSYSKPLRSSLVVTPPLWVRLQGGKAPYRLVFMREAVTLWTAIRVSIRVQARPCIVISEQDHFACAFAPSEASLKCLVKALSNWSCRMIANLDQLCNLSE
jgi:hypothetical protein